MTAAIIYAATGAGLFLILLSIVIGIKLADRKAKYDSDLDAIRRFSNPGRK